MSEDRILFPNAEKAVKAVDEYKNQILSIRHVVRVGEEWGILMHINCEDCEHCGDPHAEGTRHAISIEK